MRRWIFVLTAAALLLTFAGCATDRDSSSSSSSAPSSEKEQSPLISRSLAYLDEFQKGEFDEFYQEVSQEFLSQLPKETFAAQWSGVLAMAGNEEKVLDQSERTQGDETVVQIVTQNNLRRLVSTFSYDAKGKVQGTFVQYLPLIVEPASSDNWEEIPIQVGQGDHKLSGMLTLPKNVEHPPTVILLQGSGPMNMDEKIGTGGNRPFADIAHGLGDKGVASIRYDKRTYAYPADTVNKGIEAEYLDDAKAAVALVAADTRLDPSRIYLLGHSEGGMLAPKIAQDNPQIKGIVSLAGSLRHLEDISLDQVRASLEQDTTLSPEQKEAVLSQHEAQVEQIKNLDPADTTTVILNVPAVYWNSLNRVDSVKIVKELSIPMLILQGEEDFQVSVDKDFDLWKSTLGNRENVTFKLYPGLNHLFMKGGSHDKIDVSVYNTPGQVDPQVILDIANWVNAQ